MITIRSHLGLHQKKTEVILLNIVCSPKKHGFLCHFGISHSRVCKCSLGPLEHFTNKLSSVVRDFRLFEKVLLKRQKTMVYSKGFLSKLGHFEISHSRVCKCSLGPLEHFTNNLSSVVRDFRLFEKVLLKRQKTIVYSKGFLSKLGHFEISHSRVCKCSLGPLEHFTNKPWSVVRPLCQNLALL